MPVNESHVEISYRHTLRLMAGETRITLKYSGPSVDDGTLPIDEVIGALQGFSGAYNKVASLRHDQLEHQLRVAALKTGSFEMVILAWLVAGQSPSPFQNPEVIYDATRWVIERVFSLFEIKKHAQSGPIEVKISGDNNTLVVVNAQGAELAIPPELRELIGEKLVDADLNKIVSPLEKERISTAEITAETENLPILKETVTSEEREFFQVTSISTTRDSEVVGRLISLNKESNRGTFELPDGSHVPYKYDGPNPDSFHMQFGRRGPVRAQGTVTFDENLNPKQIEIHSLTNLQRELPLE